MIKEVKIQNYKSVQDLTLELGRVNVLIGANGCGKSNILEAIAMGSAAADNKLSNEFLSSRGIRVTEPKAMRSGFEKGSEEKNVNISFVNELNTFDFEIQNQNKIFGDWVISNLEKVARQLGKSFLINILEKYSESEHVLKSLDSETKEKFNEIEIENKDIERNKNLNNLVLSR